MGGEWEIEMMPPGFAWTGREVKGEGGGLA